VILSNHTCEWLDSIPHQWKVDKVKNHFYFSDIQTEEFDNYPVLSLTMSGIKERNLDTNEGQLPESYQKYNLVDTSCLVFNPMDLISGWVDVPKKEGLISPSYRTLKLKSKELNLHFIKYYFQSLYKEKVLFLFGEGVHYEYRWGLGKETLKNFSIPHPPIEEQIRIVSNLDKKTYQLDNLIEKIKEKIKLLKDHRVSLINEVVLKGLNPNVEMKYSGDELLGKLPKHWEVKRLKLLGKFSNGLSKGSEYFGSGFPFFTYGDVYNNESLPVKPSGLVDSDESDQNKCSVKRGDVFFTRTSESTDDIGVSSTCCIDVPQSTFSGFIIRFRPHEEFILPEYSKYLFQNHYKKTFIESRMNIVTRSSLSQSILGNVLVIFPKEKKEQLEIVEYLDHHTKIIDKLIFKENERIKTLKEYKITLISELVFGKKGLG